MIKSIPAKDNLLQKSGVSRIAYFVSDFPSKSETWVLREIIDLIGGGYDIKIFSREKKPAFILPEYHELVNKTVYRDNLFLLNITKKPLRTFSIFYRALVKIGKDFFYDTNGLRGKLQIIKDIALYISILDEINNFNPDIINVHFANAKANLALFHNLLFNTPYLIKIHAVDVFQRQNLFRLKVQKAYKILSISNYNIEFIKRRDKDIDISKFTVHHCGMPVDKYELRPHPVKNEIPVVLSVGRLTPMKGFDTLIKASFELHKKNIIHKLTIVGFGPDKDYLHKLASDLGIGNHIAFMDYCSPAEVKSLLTSSDLFVLASKYDKNKGTQDGIPVAIMEAMSIGIPVISTKISGIPELIEDGINGFLVNPDNPVELSAKIKAVFETTQNQLSEIVKNARSKIEKEFDLDKLTNELKDFLEAANRLKDKHLVEDEVS
jgi:glycosyltransferase involved in cell wall biosynthesis